MKCKIYEATCTYKATCTSNAALLGYILLLYCQSNIIILFLTDTWWYKMAVIIFTFRLFSNTHCAIRTIILLCQQNGHITVPKQHYLVIVCIVSCKDRKSFKQNKTKGTTFKYQIENVNKSSKMAVNQLREEIHLVSCKKNNVIKEW